MDRSPVAPPPGFNPFEAFTMIGSPCVPQGVMVASEPGTGRIVYLGPINLIGASNFGEWGVGTLMSFNPKDYAALRERLKAAKPDAPTVPEGVAIPSDNLGRGRG